MWDLIVGIGNLAWAIFSSAFSLYKQLTGIQNNVLAAVLGISPLLAAFLVFCLKQIKKLTH